MHLSLDVDGLLQTASRINLWGGITAFFGWISGVNWIGLVGVVVAALGLVTNVYFQLRRDRREAAEHAAKIRRLRLQAGVESAQCEA